MVFARVLESCCLCHVCVVLAVTTPVTNRTCACEGKLNPRMFVRLYD
jgi:hypothetical protein